MSMSLQEQLDRAFGDGPEHRSVEETLRAGHRSLVRRRLVAGASAVAVLAVLGSTYAVLAPGPGGKSPGEVMVEPPTTPSSLALDPGHEFAADEGPVILTPDGLAIREGATIQLQVDNPMGFEPPSESLGVVVDYRDEVTWWLLTMERDTAGEPVGSAALQGKPGGEFPAFEAWLDDIVALQQLRDLSAAADAAGAEPAAYADDGTLVLAEGVEVLDRVDDPLVPGKATGSDSVALDLTRAGRHMWVLLQTDHRGGFSVRDDAFVTHDSFEEWLADQVALKQGDVE